MKERPGPCVVTALFGTKTITVNRKSVGIPRLCDAIAAVQALGLTSETAQKDALLRQVEQETYIPDALHDAYGDALLEEYRTVLKQAGNCGRSGKIR